MLVDIDRRYPLNHMARNQQVMYEDSRSLALAQLDLSKVRFVPLQTNPADPNFAFFRKDAKFDTFPFHPERIPLDRAICNFLVGGADHSVNKLLPDHWREHRHIAFEGTIQMNLGNSMNRARTVVILSPTDQRLWSFGIYAYSYGWKNVVSAVIDA
jgi:hypothetical protein